MGRGVLDLPESYGASANTPYPVFARVEQFVEAIYEAQGADSRTNTSKNTGDVLNKFYDQGSEKKSAPAVNGSGKAGTRGNLAGRREMGVGLQYAKTANIGAVHSNREYAYLIFRWSSRAPLLGSDHLRVAVEPNIGQFRDSTAGTIAGLNLMGRYYPLLQGRVLPFAGLGTGVLLTRSPFLDFPLNFMSLAGAGFDFFLTEKLALELEYRLHHISNAGLRGPNTGINANLASASLAWYY